VSTSGVVPTTTLADPSHKRPAPTSACLLRAPTSATAPPIPATIDRCTPANAQGPTDRSHPRDPTLLAASVDESTRFCFRLMAGVCVPEVLAAVRDELQLQSLTVLLVDASSSGRPTVTPTSAGLLDAKSEDQRLTA
jgi:hypothetical protein